MKKPDKRRFEMRVTPENKRLWKIAAALEGISLTAWFRRIANSACDEADRRTKEEH